MVIFELAYDGKNGDSGEEVFHVAGRPISMTTLAALLANTDLGCRILELTTYCRTIHAEAKTFRQAANELQDTPQKGEA
jgi:hypothetical protein